VQSANTEELRILERQHTFLHVLEAVSAARAAGFSNLSVDLIFGLPEQELGTWQVTVQRVLDLRPEHVSAYALALEHGTLFGQWARKGSLPTPDPDLAADMYEWLCNELEAAGYSQYEISNWSQAGRECRHNLQYWRGLPYLGLGAGAHGYAGGYRYMNVKGIESYVNSFRQDRGSHSRGGINSSEPIRVHDRSLGFPFSPAMVDHHQQTVADNIGEYMMMGLRLTREGIAASAFRDRFGCELGAVFEPEIADLSTAGLLDLVGHAPDFRVMPPGSAPQSWGLLRLSQRGRLLGNQVFKRFIN